VRRRESVNDGGCEAQTSWYRRFLTPLDAPSGDDRRVTDAQPAEFLLDSYPETIAATGPSLRALILRTIPGAVETVRPGWRWIAYSLPDGRRVRNFAWIGPERKHIHLGFEHGTLLADPDRLLHGAEERLRKFRYFTFEPSIDVDEAVLVDFLTRAADLARLPSAARNALLETAPDAMDPDAPAVPSDLEIELVERG
jgi:hypothetical protein